MSLWTTSEVITAAKLNQKELFIGESAPGSPSDGQLWYKPSTLELQIYDAASISWKSYRKNAANGIAGLDASADVPLAQIPDTLTGKDADTVDGYHAGNEANKMPVLDGSADLPLAQIPDTLTGKDADTVDTYHGSDLIPFTTVNQPSRALDTIYQNTSGKTMAVVATITVQAYYASAYAYAQVGSSSPPSTIVCRTGAYLPANSGNFLNMTIMFFVPNNWYYRIASESSYVGLQYWTEYTY